MTSRVASRLPRRSVRFAGPNESYRDVATHTEHSQTAITQADEKVAVIATATLLSQLVDSNRVAPTTKNWLQGRRRDAHWFTHRSKDLDHIVSEYVDYFNTRRSHSSRGNLPPLATPPKVMPVLRTDQVEVKSYVGGLVKSFERKAA